MDQELFFDEDEAAQINQMMNEARNLLAVQAPVVCGDCFYYANDRSCRRHPPTIMTNGGIPTSIYPRVQPNELSCGEGVKGQRVYPEGK